jgi:hypothetical protein
MMSIEDLKAQYPVQLFYIQAAIYDGAVRFLIRENRAVLQGDHYLTVNQERVSLCSVMVQTGSIQDMELPRLIICDDPDKVDTCVEELREGLRGAVQQLKDKVEGIEQLAHGDNVVFRRLDFAWSVSGKV